MWSIWHGCSAEGKTRQPYTSTGAAKPLTLTDQVRLISTPIPSVLSFLLRQKPLKGHHVCHELQRNLHRNFTQLFQTTQEHLVMILHLAQANEDFYAKEYTKQIHAIRKAIKGEEVDGKKISITTLHSLSSTEAAVVWGRACKEKERFSVDF